MTFIIIYGLRRMIVNRFIKRILLCAGGLAFILGIIAVAVSCYARTEVGDIRDLDFSKVKTGHYEGEANWGSLVKVIVEVDVQQPQVTSIKILKHDNGLGKRAEVIVKTVLAKQSLEVDAITGATISSKTILQAIENALEKGLQ